MFRDGLVKTAAPFLESLARKVVPGHARSAAEELAKKHRGIRLLQDGKGMQWSHKPSERIERFVKNKKL